ncbi:(-)-isopiperitenol/(-)-carveol dehydrogenase [Quercus suber]|uniref:(-)-isopiperitenol/(-)-carveol dehydrogenase n=1 Tax=Quercus suber TaxID=58331 RepID=A0AAW0L806_QUESU|nr:(-)-isopiperitenol/(-)-carveol dehydrogenase, mitochondrial-like [Quercus suber]POE96628.1 (-)-isopiperitenol/(-)-carveol dehydrogenase, mitochondrial [Quercus suber]
MTDSTTPKNKLEGKVAIVTGGASGIGEATARHFATHGARAIVIADVQDEMGQSVAASISPNICSYVHCDVSDEEQVRTLVDSTVNKYGCLDIMFSNAGIGRATNTCVQSVFDIDLSAYDKLMAVNARGMVACVKHAVKAMVEGHVRGSIICTASVSASVGSYNGIVDYTMSKHAVLGLVRSASLQVGSYGIRVNCVSPGLVGTPIVKDTMRLNDEEVAKMQESVSYLKGGLLMPKNVADAVVFLASEDSQFVTGHNLVVDAGFKS